MTFHFKPCVYYALLWIRDNTTSCASIHVTLSSNISSLWAPRWVVANDGTNSSFKHSVDGQLKRWCDWNGFHRPQGDSDGAATSFSIGHGPSMIVVEDDVLGSVVVQDTLVYRKLELGAKCVSTSQQRSCLRPYIRENGSPEVRHAFSHHPSVDEQERTVWLGALVERE